MTLVGYGKFDKYMHTLKDYNVQVAINKLRVKYANIQLCYTYVACNIKTISVKIL
jgi:hypothetical protein